MRICLQLFTHLVTLNRSEGKRFVGKVPSELTMVLVMLLGGASFNAIIASSDTVFISNRLLNTGVSVREIPVFPLT